MIADREALRVCDTAAKALAENVSALCHSLTLGNREAQKLQWQR